MKKFMQRLSRMGAVGLTILALTVVVVFITAHRASAQLPRAGVWETNFVANVTASNDVSTTTEVIVTTAGVIDSIQILTPTQCRINVGLGSTLLTNNAANYIPYASNSIVSLGFAGSGGYNGSISLRQVGPVNASTGNTNVFIKAIGHY